MWGKVGVRSEDGVLGTELLNKLDWREREGMGKNLSHHEDLCIQNELDSSFFVCTHL